MKKIIQCTLLPVLALLSVFSLNAVATPGGVDAAALKLWLDASDIDGDGNSGNDPAHGTGAVSYTHLTLPTKA